jgi:hypothetical protein
MSTTTVSGALSSAPSSTTSSKRRRWRGSGARNVGRAVLRAVELHRCALHLPPEIAERVAVRIARTAAVEGDRVEAIDVDIDAGIGHRCAVQDLHDDLVGCAGAPVVGHDERERQRPAGGAAP